MLKVGVLIFLQDLQEHHQIIIDKENHNNINNNINTKKNNMQFHP